MITDQSATGPGMTTRLPPADIPDAGMRAQGHPGRGWRVLSFLRYPVTPLSSTSVAACSRRAYRVEQPGRRDGR